MPYVFSSLCLLDARALRAAVVATVVLAGGLFAAQDVHAQKADAASQSVVVRPTAYSVEPVLGPRFRAPRAGTLPAHDARAAAVGLAAPAMSKEATAEAGISRRTTLYVAGGVLAAGLVTTAAVLLAGGDDGGGSAGSGGRLADPPTRP